MAVVATLLLAQGCTGCEEDEAQPPELPPLPDEPAAHGIDTIRLSWYHPNADEERNSELSLRRDGCYRTRSSSSDGSETTVERCAACSTASAVAPIFRSVAAHLSEMRAVKPGKSGKPPFVLGSNTHGWLRVTTSAGKELVAGGDVEELESVAAQLYDEGVPNAPEPTGDRCVSSTNP